MRKTTVAQVCSTTDVWTPADRAALAVALAPFDDGSLIVRMALEWNRLRADAQACAKAQN